MNKYVKEFYKLSCSQEIIDIVSPINNLEKEITESMSIIKKLKKLF
jgi:hypothetical protein